MRKTRFFVFAAAAALLAAGPACTRIKPVTAAASTVPLASEAPTVDGTPVPFPSEAAVPTPPPPPEVPGPSVTVVSPTAFTDFTSESVEVAFTAVASPGRTVAGAQVLYDGSPIGTFDNAGPYKILGWNPNVVNNLVDPPDANVVRGGDHVMTILAKDDQGTVGKLEFSFRKQLKITGWAEVAPMPNATSHHVLFSDGSSPPQFLSIWGSTDGIETNARPRTQVYGFNPAGLGAWTEVNVNGNATPVMGAGAALHPSGQLFYLVGGRKGNQDVRTLVTFSPLRKVAENSLVTLNLARRDAAVVFTDGFLYAIGGRSGTTPMYSVERLAMAEDGAPVGNWEAVGDLINARAGATAAVVGKEIWVFGGGHRPIEVYDTVLKTWKFLTDPAGTTIGAPEAWSNSLQLAVGDRFFFFGGEKEDGQAIDRIYEFNPTVKSWREVGPLPEILDENPMLDRGETRLGGFFLDEGLYIIGGKSLPDGTLSKRAFRGQIL